MSVLLLQDACVALELSDATVLVPTVRKVLTVVSAIPKLEVFVAQVSLEGPPQQPVACIAKHYAAPSGQVFSVSWCLAAQTSVQVGTSWLRYTTCTVVVGMLLILWVLQTVDLHCCQHKPVLHHHLHYRCVRSVSGMAWHLCRTTCSKT